MSDIELEYWEGCKDFARVLEAAAKENDQAYCEETRATKQVSIYKKSCDMNVIRQFYNEIYGKPEVSKPLVKLNIANSRLFKRRFGTASEAAVATGAFGVSL
jgi:hypothetical protein